MVNNDLLNLLSNPPDQEITHWKKLTELLIAKIDPYMREIKLDRIGNIPAFYDNQIVNLVSELDSYEPSKVDWQPTQCTEKIDVNTGCIYGTIYRTLPSSTADTHIIRKYIYTAGNNWLLMTTSYQPREPNKVVTLLIEQVPFHEIMNHSDSYDTLWQNLNSWLKKWESWQRLTRDALDEAKLFAQTVNTLSMPVRI